MAKRRPKPYFNTYRPPEQYDVAPEMDLSAAKDKSMMGGEQASMAEQPRDLSAQGYMEARKRTKLRKDGQYNLYS